MRDVTCLIRLSRMIVRQLRMLSSLRNVPFFMSLSGVAMRFRGIFMMCSCFMVVVFRH
jgi:hypothetical protein